MSAESQEAFHAQLFSYRPGDDPDELRAAATGHLGASRPLEELLAEYGALMASGHLDAAQRVADELQPVRAAARVAAGQLPTGG